MRAAINGLGAVLTVAVALCASEANAGDIGHDQVYAIGAIAGPTGWRYLPAMHRPTVVFGWKACSPHPAVDWWGNTSGGLSPEGCYHCGCDKASKGANTYYQANMYGNYCAISYAFYFPKDSAAHRHDWENVVVFLNGACNTSSPVEKVCFSRHGGYACKKPPYNYVKHPDNRGPRTAVTWTTDPASFGLAGTGDLGSQHTPVSFPDLPQRVQDALNNKDWGKANFPLGKNYWSHVQKAWRS